MQLPQGALWNILGMSLSWDHGPERDRLRENPGIPMQSEGWSIVLQSGLCVWWGAASSMAVSSSPETALLAPKTFNSWELIS